MKEATTLVTKALVNVEWVEERRGRKPTDIVGDEEPGPYVGTERELPDERRRPGPDIVGDEGHGPYIGPEIISPDPHNLWV